MSSSWWIAQLSMITTLQGPGYGFNFGAYNINQLWSWWQFNIEASLTTCSFRNVRNPSLFTEPSKISRTIIPSHVRAGKTEYRWPQTKAAQQTHALPIAAQPTVHWFVWSSTLASSSQIQYSARISAYATYQVACNSSFLSNASFATCLHIIDSQWSVRERVEIEIKTSHLFRNSSWISSR